jgi:hypothetical protein
MFHRGYYLALNKYNFSLLDSPIPYTTQSHYYCFLSVSLSLKTQSSTAKMAITASVAIPSSTEPADAKM